MNIQKNNILLLLISIILHIQPVYSNVPSTGKNSLISPDATGTKNGDSVKDESNEPSLDPSKDPLTNDFKRFLELLNAEAAHPEIEQISMPVKPMQPKQPEKPSVFRNTNVSLADYAGEVPTKVQEIIDMIKYPKRYAQYNVDLPNFVLFHGPSGTGKSLLGEIIAGENNSRYLHIVASALPKRYYGEGIGELKGFFETAHKEHEKNPNLTFVIFIDEIDMMLLPETKEEQRTDLRHVLNEQLDTHTPYIFVIGATNRLSQIDETTKRRAEGYILEVGLPNKKARQALIDHYLHKMNLESYAHLFKNLASQTEGFSNAHVKSILKQVIIRVCREQADSIKPSYVKDAYKDVKKTIIGFSLAKALENSKGYFSWIGTDTQVEAVGKVFATALVGAVLNDLVRRAFDHVPFFRRHSIYNIPQQPRTT